MGLEKKVRPNFVHAKFGDRAYFIGSDSRFTSNMTKIILKGV